MALVTGLDSSKVDASRRTAIEGAKAISFPQTGLSEQKVVVSECSSCSKVNTHCPLQALGIQVPHGESRYQRVPDSNRVTLEDINELQTTLHLLGYIHQGYVGDEILFNAGSGAANASDFVTYEIVSASGSTLTLKGRNPKYISLGTSTENPNWPGEAPSSLRPAGISDAEWDAMKYGRLISGSASQVLPVGSSVEYQYPSVLHQQSYPLIEKVNAPSTDSLDDVTFSVVLDQNCSKADEPFDDYYPPSDGKYYVKIRFESSFPQNWKNIQEPKETAFTKKRIEVTEAGVIELKNTSGQSTRVLYPDFFDGAFTVQLIEQGGGTSTWSNAEIKSRLTTTQASSSSWSVDFDLSDVDFDSTYSQLNIVYHPEATSADTYRIQFQGQCSNAQVDPSGSYQMDGDSRCMSPDASEFDNFDEVCWKPDCDGFALGTDNGVDGDEGETLGTLSFGPDSIDDSDWWSGLWHRADWFIKQQIAGTSAANNFKMIRPSNAGPSIQSLCGGWMDKVPEGYFAFREPYAEPLFGKRFTMTDVDGNEYQKLVTGAFFLQSYDHTDDGGDSYEWNPSSAPEEGVIADEVFGWTTKPDALTGNVDTGLDFLPYKNTGRTNVYSYQHSSSALGRTNLRHSNSQAFITGIKLNGSEDNNVTDAVRDWFS